MKVDCFQPILDIETRTGFFHPREVSMANNLGFGIVGAEALKKLDHGLLLGWSACVGWVAVGIETALVANADAVGIVMLGMSTDFALRAAWIDDAIFGDVVVVTDGAEASCLVTGFKVFDREVAVGSGGRAMNYYKVYFSHKHKEFFFIIFSFFYYHDIFSTPLSPSCEEGGLNP